MEKHCKFQNRFSPKPEFSGFNGGRFRNPHSVEVNKPLSPNLPVVCSQFSGSSTRWRYLPQMRLNRIFLSRGSPGFFSGFGSLLAGLFQRPKAKDLSSCGLCCWSGLPLHSASSVWCSPCVLVTCRKNAGMSPPRRPIQGICDTKACRPHWLSDSQLELKCSTFPQFCGNCVCWPSCRSSKLHRDVHMGQTHPTFSWTFFC